MPVNNVGYREWNGQKRGSFSRWMAIASTGTRIAFKSQWIRRMLFVSWLPVLYIATGFFIFEKFMDDRTREAINANQAKDQSDLSKMMRDAQREIRGQRKKQGNIPPEMMGFFGALPKSQELIKSIMSDKPSDARHTTWCWLLMVFFRYPQGLLMLVLIGIIVPPLISRDLRSRAYLMYFSRPIGRFEYVLGKVAIPATFLTMITLLPAMTLYVFGVMLSPGFSVIMDTWDIPFRIVAASFVLVIPTSLLALMYSSLTHESRFAAFAWFATWGLGAGAYYAISLASLDPSKLPAGGPAAALKDDWSFLSIYATVGRVQEWIFGLESNPNSVIPYVLLLASIAVISAIVLFRRVTAPINA